MAIVNYQLSIANNLSFLRKQESTAETAIVLTAGRVFPNLSFLRKQESADGDFQLSIANNLSFLRKQESAVSSEAEFLLSLHELSQAE